MDEALEVEVRQAVDGESMGPAWAGAGQVWAEVVVVEEEWLATVKRKLNTSFLSHLPKRESLSAKVGIGNLVYIYSRFMLIECRFAYTFV